LAAGLQCVHVCMCACVFLRVYVQFDIDTKVE
jgi:hypothetical protein